MTSMNHAMANLPPAPTGADWKALLIAGALALATLPGLLTADPAKAYPWQPHHAAGMASAGSLVTAQSGEEISDETLKSFKTAKTTVMAIKDEWQNRVERGEVDAEDESAQDIVRIQMTAAIEQNGLSVDTYNRIDTALKSDALLRQRYQDLP